MKDYRKFKIIKKSLPIYCKDTNVQEIFCELSKERNAFSKKPLTESMITEILRCMLATSLNSTTEMQFVNYRSKS